MTDILTRAAVERALQDAMFAIRAKHANTDVERIRDLANAALHWQTLHELHCGVAICAWTPTDPSGKAQP